MATEINNDWSYKRLDLECTKAFLSFERCPICLEDKKNILYNSCIIGHCFHVVCYPCLRKWIKTRDLNSNIIKYCPVCKTPFWSFIRFKD